MPISIVWFRQDLRLGDNPALDAALQRGGSILPLFILEDDPANPWPVGGAGRWWLHHSLSALSASLEKLGVPLILKRGKAKEVLPIVIAESGADAVFWNRCYDPFAIERDHSIKRHLRQSGCAAASFNGSLLAEPWTLQTQAGNPFKVFTPFWHALVRKGVGGPPLPARDKLPAQGEATLQGDRLADWRLLPRNPDWATGFTDFWIPGEAGAKDRLRSFLDETIGDYAEGRNRPDRPFVSRLSPHLHWGELSPRQVWQATLMASDNDESSERLKTSGWTFLRELGWRDFSHHLLYHWPELAERNWRDQFDSFPWQNDEAAFKAWCRGRTGYPIVDAGMRQLRSIGWMHNRLRMIAASFLVKDLLIDWRRGAEWFWDTLVDADLASNSASWQWVAGSGADAAPYFRIFNPVTQGEKFDPKGDCLRTWLPELAKLPAKWIHKPWEAPETVLRDANLRLGEDYPGPIIDHAAARRRALNAFREIKKDAG